MAGGGQRHALATLPSGLVMTGVENLASAGIRSPDCPAPTSHYTDHALPAAPHFSGADTPIYD